VSDVWGHLFTGAARRRRANKTGILGVIQMCGDRLHAGFTWLGGYGSLHAGNLTSNGGVVVGIVGPVLWQPILGRRVSNLGSAYPLFSGIKESLRHVIGSFHLIVII
jgi:hypothetical protein